MTYVDQLKNKIQINAIPKRIISLVPSQSEYLWDLGLHHELIGISKFCVHPQKMFETVTRVGGTKWLDLEKIKWLKPDLIIGNKEENVKEQMEELQNYFPVWMSDVSNLEEAYDMMLRVGEVCNRKAESECMVEKILFEMKAVKNVFCKKKVTYFIWNKPYMVAAADTFIHSVLKWCGFVNSFEDKLRYPEMNVETIKIIEPDYCFLSSEPFPFNQSHQNELQSQLPHTKVVLVDGEMFSWYGSRLLSLPPYLQKLKIELND